MPGLKGDYGNADRNPIRRRFRPSDVILRGRGPQDAFDRFQFTGDGESRVGDGTLAPFIPNDFSEAFTAGGQAYPPRMNSVLLNNASITMTSQNFRLLYWRACRTEVVGTAVLHSGATAAGATPTLVRYGLYLVDNVGNLTLIASTPNDTTLYASTNTRYTRALSDSYKLVRGVRYAHGLLVVTGAAAPTVIGNVQGTDNAGFRTELSQEPRHTGVITGQADLPLAITAGTVAVSGAYCYSALLP